MTVAEQNRTDVRTVERIVGGETVLDKVLAEERLRCGQETAQIDGAGIVKGVLLGGVSWAVFIAGFFWFISR